MSGWFDSFNQAVGLTEDPAEVAGRAADQQAAAQERALALQRDLYNYQRGVQQPFYAGSLPAYYSLVSAITGQPQTYADPNYQRLDSEELAKLNKVTPGKYPSDQVWYRGPNGEITKTPPTMSSSVWNPQETPAFQWQQQQQDKNLGRALRTLGRQNSTYGMDTFAKANQNLYTAEYDKQLGRLADLTNIARGGASSLANAAAGYGTSAASGIVNAGNNMANATLAGGMLNQNQLYNNVNTIGGLGNLGIKLYDYFKNRNSGGDSGGYSGAQSYDSSGWGDWSNNNVGTYSNGNYNSIYGGMASF